MTWVSRTVIAHPPVTTPPRTPLPAQPDDLLPSTRPGISPDARDLLVAATTPGGTGWIVVAFAPGFGSVGAGGRQFVAGSSRAELERWKAALDELLAADLICGPGPCGLLFKVTSAGYGAAQRLG